MSAWTTAAGVLLATAWSQAVWSAWPVEWYTARASRSDSRQGYTTYYRPLVPPGWSSTTVYRQHSAWSWRPPLVVLPPLVVPAEELYGPRALRQFVGVDAEVDRAPVSVPRMSPAMAIPNAERRARVERLLRSGDAQFRQQKFPAALERYRSAVEVAPTLPAPHVRQAMAHVASGNYEAAARAFRRALRADSRAEIDDSPVLLMYGEDPMPKMAHFDALALAVEKNLDNADLHLVLGMMLLLDGRPDKAQPFLARCDELGGNTAGLLDELLARDPTQAPNPPAARANLPRAVGREF